MPTPVERIPRNQINLLESGLKSLKQSKLINSPEMRNMYTAIESHHKDVQLSHLTGKPKDLLEQARQDTKFFYILTKMLTEVLIGTQQEQKDNLREVYSWYQSNKHILHSGPRFGKQKENKAPKSAKGRVKSAATRPGSGVTDVSSVPVRGRPGSSVAKLGHVQKQASEALAKGVTDLTELTALHQIQEQRGKLHFGGQSSQSIDLSSRGAQSSMSATMSQREESASPDTLSSATKRISEPYQHLLPKRTPQPLSHMYNPHARDTEATSQGDGPVRLKTTGVRSHSQVQPGEPKSANLKKWENFQQQFNYGQEILSKLAYCGRTGVAGGVRYIAHEGGLAAEFMTPVVVSSYAAAHEKPQKEPVKNMLAEKSLEEFYEVADGYYPAHLPKYPSFRLKSAPSTGRAGPNPPNGAKVTTQGAKVNQQGFKAVSASGGVTTKAPRVTIVTETDNKSQTSLCPPAPYSPRSAKSSVVSFEGETEDEEGDGEQRDVRIDTVVNMIDSVTDELTTYKEKILPDPQPGFRRPTQEVDPLERPQTAPIMGTVARPSSPLCDDDRPATSASVATAPPGMLHPLIPAGYEESLPGYQYERPLSRARTPGAESTASNRGKVGAEITRYNEVEEYVIHDEVTHLPSIVPQDPVNPEKDKQNRWQETPSGGYAYYKKSGGPSLRSAGKAKAGGRPKTAPQNPQERWPNSKPSDDNKKASVAASHTTTEVDDSAMQNLFEVRHLGGKYAKQRRRYYMDFRLDSRERPYSSMTTCTPTMEYLSFIAPKPVSRASSAVTRSRMGSAMDGGSPFPLPTEEGDFDEDMEDEDEGSMDSMGNDLDLPDVDDLDDDLVGDYQFDGDMPEDGEDLGNIDEMGGLSPGRDDLMAEDGEMVGERDTQEFERPPPPLDLNDPVDLGEALPTPDSAAGHQGAGSSEEETSEQDFDSVKIQSSTQESDSQLDVDRQMSDSRRLIDEIQDLVTHGAQRREVRPVSSHSRVTFQEDRMEKSIDQNKSEPSEGGKKVLKPKSILVPRHIQPPPSVGLTIRQFNRGADTIHEPIEEGETSARQEPKQTASKTEHRGYAAGDMDMSEIGSPRTSAIKPRIFTHSFPKQLPHPPAEEDLGLSVQGHGGIRKGRVRSAGMSPARAQAMTPIKVLQRQREMLHNSPSRAYRTAPSIPSAHHPFGSKASGGGTPFMPELENRARRDRSPRSFMHKVGMLRSKSDLDWVPSVPNRQEDGLLTTTLRVSRMKPAGRTDNLSPEEQRQGYPGTPVSYFEDDDASTKSGKSESVSELTVGSSQKPMCVFIYNNQPASQGRPIPDYGEAKTPEEYQAAMQKQKEAKAIVDIQRIFRGYAVRKYKHLLWEERVKREDQRKAAVEIQRAYRGHLVRKKQIYSRQGINVETLDWAKDFKSEQEVRERERKFKAAKRAEEDAKNKATADAKISIIGPHVEVYAPFHPKKVGIDKSVLHKAATAIQRHLKGWHVRKKFEKVQRKSKLHASSWPRFMSQYRDLQRRVQARHGIDRPEMPFNFDDISEFMDLKKRYEAKFTKIATGPYFDGYESGFESYAFAGELEFDELDVYFRECDLYPAQADVEDAIDLVFREPEFASPPPEPEDEGLRQSLEKGQDITKKRGLQRHQVLELTFHLYPPPGTGITNARRSTWMNPIVEGEEAIKLLGTDGVEPTDFKTVWTLVSDVRREKREAENLAEKEKRDEQHKNIMAAKRERDIALRNELRMLGMSGHAQRRPVKDELAEINETDQSENKEDKRVTFSKEVQGQEKVKAQEKQKRSDESGGQKGHEVTRSQKDVRKRDDSGDGPDD